MEQKLHKVFRWLKSKECGVIILQNLIFALIVGLILTSVQFLIQNQQTQEAREESISRVDVSMLTNQRDEFIKKMSQYFVLLYQLAGKAREDPSADITQFIEDCEPEAKSLKPKSDSSDSKSSSSKSCPKLYSHLTTLTISDLDINKMILVNTIKAFNHSNSSTNSEEVSKELETLISDLSSLNSLMADSDKFKESYNSNDAKFCPQDKANSELCQALETVNQTFVKSLKMINKSLINTIYEK